MSVNETNKTLIKHTEWLLNTFSHCLQEATVAEDHQSRILNASQAIGLGKAIVANMEAQISTVQYLQGMLRSTIDEEPEMALAVDEDFS